MLNHVKILLVDDNEAHRYALSRQLRAAGEVVMEASTGAEAIDLASRRPDVIVLDVNLPDMNGFEVCRRIKRDAHTAHIPVVFLSATYPPWSGHDEATAAGGATFLVHPVTVEQLRNIIAGTMLKARAASAA